MFLENLVIDSVHPRRLGAFWESALGTTRLTDEPDLFETRLAVAGGAALDLCSQRVPEPPTEPQRLHLDLLGGHRQAEVTVRLLGLGAQPLDIGQGNAPWKVLADVEDTPFCVMEEREAYVDTGAIAALPLDSADPGRDAGFWSWLTGWIDMPGIPAPWSALRHPSLRGPLLELCPQEQPKGAAKNRIHLDVRLEGDDDPEAVTADIVARGGTERSPDWGELPWSVFADPSGNEFCVLPARAA